MKLFLASSNPHKAEEFSELFKGSGLVVEAAPEKLDVVEDGTTFNQNAFLKAKAYFDKFKTPTIADDSGLVVEAFPDQLGVHSARFAPECETYAEKCTKLISMLDSYPQEKRAAYFVCYICIYINEGEIYNFEGRVKGHIGDEMKGDHGFGYDPIFIPEGKNSTLAELPEWKMENSHRAKASKMVVDFFKEYIANSK